VFIPAFLISMLLSLALVPWLGSNFFPSVDSGEIKLHVRGHAGLRVEETARLCDAVETALRNIVPPNEIASLVDNIGLPVSGINLSYSNSAPTTAADADILVTLKKGHGPTGDYTRRLRAALPTEFPGVTFAFLPADIVTQILNFGAPAPIDIQVRGLRTASAAARPACAWRRRRTHPAGARLSGIRRQGRSQPSPGTRFFAARYCE
jgi:multidrug efflux pump subunit AcrB